MFFGRKLRIKIVFSALVFCPSKESFIDISEWHFSASTFYWYFRVTLLCFHRRWQPRPRPDAENWCGPRFLTFCWRRTHVIHKHVLGKKGLWYVNMKNERKKRKKTKADKPPSIWISRKQTRFLFLSVFLEPILDWSMKAVLVPVLFAVLS